MIYTFYSYKGGVGRSMAMANVAEYFYLKGLRVVMIDWDLEAPGLESFFYDVSRDEGKAAAAGVRARLGLIDLLVSYKQQFPALTFPEPPAPREETEEEKAERERRESEETEDERKKREAEEEEEEERKTREHFRAQVDALKSQLPPIGEQLCPLRPKGANSEHPEAALWLMPAGWRAGERFTGYAQAVQGFDWTDFYVNYKGKAFFEWMREGLEGLADVILVDSRTGVTEMGGVCTRQLANVVVSCTVLNYQNMEGVSKMMQTFGLPGVLRARDGRRLDSVVVPTRVDTSDTDTRAGLIKTFEQIFRPEDFPAEYKQVGTSYWRTAIPYVSKYAYSERLAIGAADYSFELQDAYRSLAAHLALFAREGSPLRTRLANDLVEFRIVPRRVPAMAPPLPPAYAHRPVEFGRLREALVGGGGAKVVALCGPPGSGKSSLAAAVACDPMVKNAYSDGVLWLTLGARPDLKEALAGVYAELTNETRPFSSDEEALKLVGEHLMDKRSLFVVDDAFRAEHVASLLALGPKCNYLVTTRDMNLASDLHASIVTVGTFTQEEALEYLVAVSKFPEELRGELAGLTGRLGHLPLLVRLAGKELRRRIESLNDTPSNAIAHANRLLDERGIFAFDQPNASDRNKSVALSLRHSLDMLSQDELDQYLRLVLKLSDGEAGVERVAEIWGTGGAEVEGRLQRLHALSLLEYDVRHRRVRLSRLIRSYALERLPANTGLDIRAEIVFSELPQDEQEAARRILTRLAPVQGQDAGADGKRVRMRRDSFGEADLKVVEKLVSAGLLISRPDKVTGQQRVLLSNASLAQKWDRLRRWVEADRDFLLWRRRITPGVEEWGRGQGVLLRGVELAAARAWVEKRGGELDPAETRYVSESARVFSARRLRAGVLFALGAVVVVATLLAVWTRQQQNSRADELVRQGVESARVGDYGGAVRSFDEAIALFPERAEYYNRRGLARASNGEREQALSDFNEAVRLNPEYAEGYFNRGVIVMQGGNASAAAADFRRVIELSNDPNLAASARRYLDSLLVQTPTQNNYNTNANGTNINNANTNNAITNNANTNTSANSNANQQSPPHVSNRLYVKYSGAGDEAVVNELELMLAAGTKLTPAKSQMVAPQRSAQVRYYYDDDIDVARRVRTLVSGLLSKRGVNVEVSLVKLSPGGEGAGHIEVWLPPLRTGPANR